MEPLQEMEELKNTWSFQQSELRNKIIEIDSDVKLKNDEWKYVGGLDISFIIGDDVNACACYVIINRDLEVVFQSCQMVEITAPYVPGFLAFREASFLIDLISKQRNEAIDLTPDLLMVDGNGLLHPRECGIACHIGVVTGLPTLGVAKNLHQIQEFGPEFQRDNVKERFSGISTAGEYITLSKSQGRVLGAAVKTTMESKNPIYVSVGSGVSLETGINIVSRLSKHRIPEPTRQADIISREYLRTRS